MSRFDLLVFDLDGTLAETRHAIAWALNRTLARIGREELPLETIVSYVGDGAATLIARALGDGAGAEELSRARGLFVEIYASDPLRETTLYEGVSETLAALAPRPLCVLSNKPGALARQVVAGLGLAPYFREVLGADDGPTRKPDPQGLLGLCERAGIPPERTLLVGDSGVDVQTARAGGASSAGVLFGFRPDHFAADPPDWTVSRFPELLDLVG